MALSVGFRVIMTLKMSILIIILLTILILLVTIFIIGILQLLERIRRRVVTIVKIFRGVWALGYRL